MKTSLAVIGYVALFTFSAVAQDVPATETFLGYTYTRFNSATNIPAYSSNGGSAQFASNFNSWFSGVIDIGAVHNGNIGGFQLDNTMTNALLGPRFSLRYSRVRPYVQTLFGAVHASASTQLTGDREPILLVPTPYDPTLPIVALPIDPFPGHPVTARAVSAQTKFAMAFGGGLDIKINKNWSFRPIGLDWYMTNLTNLRAADGNHQHNLRYTTGVNFTFGAL